MSKGNKLRSIGDIEVGSHKLRSASDRLDEPLYKRHFPKTLATRDDSFFDSIYADNPRIAQHNLKPTQNPLRQGSSNKPSVATAKRSAKAARLKRLNDKINEVLENFDKTLSRRDFNEYVSELGDVIQQESKQGGHRIQSLNRKKQNRPTLSSDATTSTLHSKMQPSLDHHVIKDPTSSANTDYNDNLNSDDDEEDEDIDPLQTELEMRRAAANQKLMDMVKIAHNEYLKCVDEEAAAAQQLQEANRLVREAEMRKDRESEKLATIDQRLSVIQSLNPRESMYLEQMKKESETRLSVLETDIRDLKQSTDLRSNLQDAESKRVAAETRAETLQKELEAFRTALSTRNSVQSSAPVMRETTVMRDPARDSATTTGSTSSSAVTAVESSRNTTTATVSQVSEDIKKDLDRLAALEAKILQLETKVTTQQNESRIAELEMQLVNETALTSLFKSNTGSGLTGSKALDAVTAEERDLEIEAMIRMDMYESENAQYEYESLEAMNSYGREFRSLEDEASHEMFLHEDEEEALIQEAYNRLLLEEQEEQDRLREIEWEIDVERQHEDEYQQYLAEQEHANWLKEERDRKEKAFQDFLRMKKESIQSIELSRVQELEKQRAFEEYKLQRLQLSSKKKSSKK